MAVISTAFVISGTRCQFQLVYQQAIKKE